MNGLALCAGIGGLELGIGLACPDYRTVCYVEREAHAAAALVAGMEVAALDRAPIWDDLRSFDGKPWCGLVDCVSAGYPCQPFSHAGKRAGTDDERHLWPEIARIVGECRPRWCFFENVAGHLSLGFEEVVSDLERMGYRVAAGLFQAAEVGAPHRRERLFVLANRAELQRQAIERGEPDGVGRCLDQPKDTNRWRTSGATDGRRRAKKAGGSNPFPPGPDEDWSGQPRGLRPALPQSEICGVADGLASRVDRLRACGNAVVPVVAGYALVALANALGCARDLGCAEIPAQPVGVVA